MFNARKILAKLTPKSLLAPSAAVVAIAVALLIGTIVYVAHRANEAAKIHEEAVVANGLNVQIAEIAGAAYQALAIGDDKAASAFDSLTVLDKNGAPVTDARRQAPLKADANFLAASASLIRDVRQIEQALAATTTDEGPGARAQTSAVARIEGRLYVLTATLFDRAGDGGKSLIGVSAKRLDDQFITLLGERFLLDGLTLSEGDAATAGPARVPLMNPDGVELAAVEWWPSMPGQQLLSNALPPAATLVTALLGVGWILFRRGRKNAMNLAASEARATHLAYHDALTALPNRLLLSDKLSHAVENLRHRQTPFAVHFVDLDRFKEVNDSFGHQVGDELIIMVGDKLSALCRTEDTVARLGGDEFAIVQIGACAETAGALAGRVVAALGEPMLLSVGNVHIGGSIGVAVFAESVSEASECLRQADLALYRAKENGRGCYCLFEMEMDAAVRFRRSLQEDLHTALAEEKLYLVYQPQVDGRGAVIGLEALVRWDHPTRGAISPTVFVPIAEEGGLIETLGYFTLRRAFEDSRRWPGTKIAINISATHLRLKHFADRLAALVKELEIDPANFELEITEGVLLGDDPQTHATLDKVRRMGFSFALDDFGTGYSSLSYLQRYPIDKIKIDRSFISTLGVEVEADAVVVAIVRLARAMNLSVIAEGVETDEQRSRLARAGCDEVQGFLVGHPSPAALIDLLVQSGHAQETDRRPERAA